MNGFVHPYSYWLTLTIVLTLCCGPGLFVSPSAIAAPPGWNMVWNDEFEGSTVDTTKWDPIFWTTPHNNERQAYHPSRVTVAHGNLVLTADDANFGGKSYTSGKVESKYAQQYGRWEIRAKLPGTRGTWPAIWLLPDTNQWGWPSQGEIDILENRGNQPNLTSSAYHWGPNFQGHQYHFGEQRLSQFGQLENFHDDYHTYAVEWDADKIRFFVDDVHHFTMHNADTGGFIANQTAPMEVNINVAVGGDFLGGAQPNSSSVWPQQMLVDYVRIYERDQAPPPVVFHNGSFDAQEGSLARWSIFGNRMEGSANVSVHNEATQDGNASLKLFGQFNGQQNVSGVEQGISVSEGDSISATASALIRSLDSIAGTENRVDMKFDYYQQFGGKFGSNMYLGSKTVTLVDGGSPNDQWLEFELNDVVPANAVEARLAIVFVQPNGEGGAVHVDGVSFTNHDLQFNADANGDGSVDGADLLKWQQNVGSQASGIEDGDFNYDGVVDNEDLEVWKSQYGENPQSASSIPEPHSLSLALISLFWTFLSRNE